ncbi:MAG: fibronectin type III domain-containing protein [Candidatus Diapherotrites archaeon]
MKRLGLFCILILLLVNSAFAVTPVISSFAIANGAQYTKTTAVTLNISATDANGMAFSCDNSTYEAYVAYAATSSFDFSTGGGCNADNGTKTVHIKVESTDANTATSSDTIIFDNVAPTISNLSPANGATPSNLSQPITASLSDATSDINSATITMNVEGTNYAVTSAELDFASGTVTFTPSTPFTVGQEVNVTLDAKDNAGNSATQSVWAFTIAAAADTTAPDDITGLTVTELSDTSVQLDWAASGAGDLDHYNIYQETSAITDVTSLTAIDTTDSSTTTYEASSLTTNQNYYFAVTAVDTNSNEDKSVTAVSVSPGTPTAPGKPSVSAGNGAVTVSWSAHGEVDVTGIKIYRITAGQAWDANTLVTTVAKGTTTYLNSGLGNGTDYYFKITAVDAAGNESPASESSDIVTPVASGCSLGTPVIESSSHPENTWDADGTIELSWATVANATGYSYEFNDSSSTTPDESIDRSDTSMTDSKSDGTWYFHLRACNGICCGNTDHYTIKVDTTGPTTPGSFTATASSDGSVRLEWAASSDDHAGMDYYEIYRSVFRNFNIADAATDKIDTTTNRYYTDVASNMAANTTYYYKIRPIDNVGNQGSMSPERTVRPEIGCDITINIDVDAYVKEGTVDVSVSSTGGKMYDTDVKLKKGGQTTRLEENKNNTSLISTSFTVESGETGNAQILVMGKDSENNLCDALADFYIDAAEPSVSWEAPAENTEIGGTVDLKADASDNGSGIRTVNFYYKSTGDWEKISGVTGKTGGSYVYKWDTSEMADGQYELKAEVVDKAANADEAIISVTLKNNGGSPPEPPPTDETTYKTAKYNFSTDNLAGLVNATNLIGTQSEKAVELLAENNVERNLKITKKGSDALATYDAKIEIKFTNNSGEAKTIQIIEFVPKSFAGDSSEISGGFTVIESDPIIKFSAEVLAGETATFSYGLNGLSKGEADALIDDGVINDFIAPPIPLLSGETPSFKQAAGEGLDLVTIIIILIILLVVIALIFVLFGSGLFVRHSYKKYKKVKSEGSGPWGLNDAVKKVHKEDSIWSNVSRDLDDWFNAKEKEGPKEGKFSWRPERK